VPLPDESVTYGDMGSTIAALRLTVALLMPFADGLIRSKA